MAVLSGSWGAIRGPRFEGAEAVEPPRGVGARGGSVVVELLVELERTYRRGVCLERELVVLELLGLELVARDIPSSWAAEGGGLGLVEVVRSGNAAFAGAAVAWWCRCRSERCGRDRAWRR